jgi:hypothetical protein
MYAILGRNVDLADLEDEKGREAVEKMCGLYYVKRFKK